MVLSREKWDLLNLWLYLAELKVLSIWIEIVWIRRIANVAFGITVRNSNF